MSCGLLERTDLCMVMGPHLCRFTPLSAWGKAYTPVAPPVYPIQTDPEVAST